MDERNLMARSPNPDLIFPDILNSRARRVARAFSQGEFCGKDMHLDRVTLFLTHRCNLACTYCNGPHHRRSYSESERNGLLNANVSMAQYSRWLDDWSRHGLDHIHFTGGEATLHPHLREFIRLAADRTILTSLTSNGTAGFELYRSLVESGLTELRISLDLADEASVDRITGVAGAGRTIIGNIRRLAEWKRTSGLPFFLILNTCIGRFNLDRIHETVERLAELSPDDIKLLVIAEESGAVCSHGAGAKIRELLAFTHQRRPDYELLRMKICDLFRPASRGLTDLAARAEIRQCFIPLSERTMDAASLYPCSIYLRCRGKALLPADADFGEQQRAISEFVASHDCREDAICRENCTRCCREYNLAVNRSYHQCVDETFIQDEEVYEIAAIESCERERIIAEDEAISGAAEIHPADPFMVIKPLGYPSRDDIRSYLAEMGVPILHEFELPDWNRISLFLYLRGKRGPAAEFRIARNRAYRLFEPHFPAILLQFPKDIPENKLFQIKYELRSLYGEELGLFRFENKSHLLKATCVHVPNYEDLPHEHRVIRHFTY